MLALPVRTSSHDRACCSSSAYLWDTADCTFLKRHIFNGESPVKLLVANIPAADQLSDGGRYIRETLVPITRRNMRLAAQPTSEIVFRFASAGISHPAFADFRFLPDLNPHAMIEGVAWAEKNGFDAAILGCFGDPFLGQIRASSTIPVIGMGEAAIQAASARGQFGIVTPSALLIEPTQQQVAALGLSDSLAGVAVSREPGSEQEYALIEASAAIEHFIAVARTLIALGARSIIPGCGILSPALRLAPGADSLYPFGLLEVDGVPVIDVFGCAVRAAEAAVSRENARDSLLGDLSRTSTAAPNTANYSSGAFWNC